MYDICLDCANVMQGMLEGEACAHCGSTDVVQISRDSEHQLEALVREYLGLQDA